MAKSIPAFVTGLMSANKNTKAPAVGKKLATKPVRGGQKPKAKPSKSRRPSY